MDTSFIDDALATDNPAVKTGMEVLETAIEDKLGAKPKLENFAPGKVKSVVEEGSAAVEAAASDAVGFASEKFQEDAAAILVAEDALVSAGGTIVESAQSNAGDFLSDVQNAANINKDNIIESVLNAPETAKGLVASAKENYGELKATVEEQVAEAKSAAEDALAEISETYDALLERAHEFYDELEEILVATIGHFVEVQEPAEKVETETDQPAQAEAVPVPAPVVVPAAEETTHYEDKNKQVPDQPLDDHIPYFSLHAVEAPDEFVVREFKYSDALFALPELTIELASQNPEIELAKLLDTPATLTIHNPDFGTRHISGIISQIARGDSGISRDIEDITEDDDLGRIRTYYSMVIEPALHRLKLGSDHKVFKRQSVPEVVEQVIKDHAGAIDVSLQTEGQHAEREYLVQHDETHLEFIERIMAEEGIWYYFTSAEKGKHTVHIVDNPSTSPTHENLKTLSYEPNPGPSLGDFRTADVCTSFAVKEQLCSTRIVQRDYTFKKPDYDQEQTASSDSANAAKHDYEIYSYPGRYKNDETGAPISAYKLEALNAESVTAKGKTTSPHIYAGHVFELSGHHIKSYDAPYRLLKAVHRGMQPQSLEEDAAPDGQMTYQVEFEAMPARLPYRPTFTRSRSSRQKVATKPRITGPQIGTVVGPDGDEIYVDELGRVQVRFAWDRIHSGSAPSTSWVRVASSWAGMGYGTIALPRVGTEVLVEFIDGDVDQPIITGQLFNANTELPYELGGHKSKMVMRSKSHNSDDGFNEISMEDAAGEERLFFRAQSSLASFAKGLSASFVGKTSLDAVGSTRYNFQKFHLSKTEAGMTTLVGGDNILEKAAKKAGAGTYRAAALKSVAKIGGSDVISDVSSVIAHGVKDGMTASASLGDGDVTAYLTTLKTFDGTLDEKVIVRLLQHEIKTGAKDTDSGSSLVELAKMLDTVTGGATAAAGSAAKDAVGGGVAGEVAKAVFLKKFGKELGSLKSILQKGLYRLVAHKHIDLTAGKSLIANVGKYINLSSKGRLSLHANENMFQKAKKKYETESTWNTHDVKKNFKVKAGNNIVLEAKDEIRLKVGDCQLIMNDKGVRIEGDKIVEKGKSRIAQDAQGKFLMNAKGQIDIKTRAMLKAKATKIDLN